MTFALIAQIVTYVAPRLDSRANTNWRKITLNRHQLQITPNPIMLSIGKLGTSVPVDALWNIR